MKEPMLSSEKFAERIQALKEPVPMMASGGVWLAVHSALCFSLQHPGEMHADTATILEAFRQAVGQILVGSGVLTKTEYERLFEEHSQAVQLANQTLEAAAGKTAH